MEFVDSNLNWFTNFLPEGVLLMDHMNSNEDTGSSPRGNKKLSFKNTRKSSSAVASAGVAAAAATTPPESPMPPPRRPKDGSAQHAAQRNK